MKNFWSGLIAGLFLFGSAQAETITALSFLDDSEYSQALSLGLMVGTMYTLDSLAPPYASCVREKLGPSTIRAGARMLYQGLPKSVKGELDSRNPVGVATYLMQEIISATCSIPAEQLRPFEHRNIPTEALQRLKPER